MSQRPLLIVESPSKARTIEQYLGGDYEVAASVGHVKDLPSNELGVDIENNFEKWYSPFLSDFSEDLTPFHCGITHHPVATSK